MLLVDAQPRILGTYDRRLAAGAERELRRLGVELVLGARVTAVDERGIDLLTADGVSQRVDARTKIWAAGVQPSPLGVQVAAAADIAHAPGGRVPVRPDLTLPGHPEVFVVGDLMERRPAGRGRGGDPIRSARGHTDRPPARRTPGQRAVPVPRRRLSRRRLALLRHRPAGTAPPLRAPAWIVWLFVHLVFLTGFKGRAATLVQWCASLFGRSRDDRTVTLRQVLARQAISPAGGARSPGSDGAAEFASVSGHPAG